MNGELEHSISSAPIRPEEGLTVAVDVFAAPKVAMAAEQALLFWQMLQSRPLKPDVHCPEPVHPVDDAVFTSCVRFEGLAMGFPQAMAEQLPPL